MVTGVHGYIVITLPSAMRVNRSSITGLSTLVLHGITVTVTVGVRVRCFVVTGGMSGCCTAAFQEEEVDDLGQSQG